MSIKIEEANNSDRSMDNFGSRLVFDDFFICLFFIKLSEIVFKRTYAKTLDNGKKETFEETVERVENMHIRKYLAHAVDIHRHFNQVRNKRVVPSMRSMQFAGDPIERSNCRLYNCSFTLIQSFEDVGDILFLLCCGTGCGYSVQKRHIASLPVIGEGKQDLFVIPDDKEGFFFFFSPPSLFFFFFFI
jgi:ribonucleoside-diphosphate reductase alpha chain